MPVLSGKLNTSVSHGRLTPNGAPSAFREDFGQQSRQGCNPLSLARSAHPCCRGN
ncbi:hypothetical protein CY34DRAFT_808943 [Suillus luteus UH-Slu-Lm8-n1]|uniref:Unplaced genomic scaffold CY34scaffold_239, whole genome shotgun sequence n=1 Tax=Suillus luteus UH-Slu-Lm8-n1 TaxID=930992 RepID=A0A0D0AL54_9AGAM|nr:hypothetical protein CY34DRAFT_808943 [Suillus luteus UH-Slu-Lm8-n1]